LDRSSSIVGHPRLGRRSAVLCLGLTGLAFAFTLLVRRPGFADPDQVWAEGQAALRSGRLEAASTALARLERLRKPTPLDWLLHAQVATGLGRDEQALRALEKVPDAHSMAAQAALLAGRIERRLHRLRRAEKSLRTALARDPGLIEAHKELIYIYGIQLRKREIDLEFKAIARLGHLTHHDLFTWGLTHFTDWDRGIAPDLEAAIEADSDDRHSRLALATLLFDQPDMALKVQQTLEPLPPDDPDATALRIELYLAHGRLEEAQSLLEKASRGGRPLARLRGRAALLRRDPAAAIGHFREALSDLPCDRVALSELGKALLLSGDRPAAEAYMAQARKLDDVYKLINRVSRPDRENDRGDLTRLGNACEAAGLSEEARGWYELAIGQEPFDAVAQQGLRRLHDAERAPNSKTGGRAHAAEIDPAQSPSSILAR
jgi:tetratricopeptide (TPR) repeat protein